MYYSARWLLKIQTYCSDSLRPLLRQRVLRDARKNTPPPPFYAGKRVWPRVVKEQVQGLGYSIWCLYPLPPQKKNSLSGGFLNFSFVQGVVLYCTTYPGVVFYYTTCPGGCQMVSVICSTRTCLCCCFVQGVPVVILIMWNGVCHLWYTYLSVLLFCPGGVYCKCTMHKQCAVYPCI